MLMFKMFFSAGSQYERLHGVKKTKQNNKQSSVYIFINLMLQNALLVKVEYTHLKPIRFLYFAKRITFLYIYMLGFLCAFVLIFLFMLKKKFGNTS